MGWFLRLGNILVAKMIELLFAAPRCRIVAVLASGKPQGHTVYWAAPYCRRVSFPTRDGHPCSETPTPNHRNPC
jgi:hypothetical protein